MWTLIKSLAALRGELKYHQHISLISSLQQYFPSSRHTLHSFPIQLRASLASTMLLNQVSYFLVALVAGTHAFTVRRAGNASAPSLPDRQPFGFGSDVTGGGTPTDDNTFIVDNMMDLRTALNSTQARTIYVKGEITGTQINETATANCQYYIDNSGVPNYNFTLYLMAMNETYMDAVKAAAAAGEEFDGQNSTEYLTLLNRQNVSQIHLSPFLQVACSSSDRYTFFGEQN